MHHISTGIILGMTFCIGFFAFRSTHLQKEIEKQYSTTMTADQVLAEIQSHLTCEWSDETVDTYKSGTGTSAVTGIATTFLATQEVLQKAAERGLNMVITHEPTFYNHLDNTEFFASDPVFEAKRAFIEEHNMVVLRFHDHWHRTNPDGVRVGMIHRLGWEQYQSTAHPMVFNLPEQTVSQLAKQLSNHFGTSALTVVGDPDMEITKVGFSMGAPGSQSQIKMLRRPDVEALIIGETHQWETVEYVRDAVTQGKQKALVLLGHANSEEAGMAYCAEWLKTFISEVPIEFIEAGDPLWSPK